MRVHLALLRDICRFPGCGCERRHLAIALNKLDREIKRQQAIEGLSRHRARKHVSANHRLIDLLSTDFTNDRLKRREVAVNVV